MRFLIAFILIPFLLCGQTQKIILGNIINSKTKDPIPFAAIGLVKENIGTNADEQGKFSLTAQKQIANDSLIISCVGYETIKIPVHDFTNGTLIELNQRITNLAEVTVKTNYKWTVTVLNHFSGCGNETLSTNGWQTQIAQHFFAPVDNSTLAEVKVCCGFWIFYFKKARFRIRVYDIDSVNGGPSSDLTDEIIEVNSNGKQEKINVEKYHIQIPNKDFFIAIEWLKIPMNAEVGRGGIIDTVYRPHIGCYQNGNDKGETWSLFYNTKWIHDTFITDLRISATVKY